jgi:putative transposase
MIPGASYRRICLMLDVSRSTLVKRANRTRAAKQDDTALEARMKDLIKDYPTFGYRRIWALLYFREGIRVNKKKIYRIFRVNRWFVHHRSITPKPRVKAIKSRSEKSNTRWGMDLTHVYCGMDGWGHLAAVIDCCDRELIGHEFSLRGRAREAERAIEDACLNRFGTLRPKGETPVVRSDNGLVFQSRRFRAACRQYRLSQEFITPYTPEQNGIIERFFRSLKEECVWQHNFSSFEEARRVITEWIQWYNDERPHQALGYKSPREFRAKQSCQVA